ncbi:hypothetical protein KIPB_007979 [Kipferlia bialata]|uniref:Uncharacterized protein n=1 Tax=Kipferlia bialata TaxID=797122 RepID=A0A9K3CZZ8_9EUKA|nr:hypothetical protein KIPB_007979 [Kipferlia bialata]|eukprot:g7979.t1
MVNYLTAPHDRERETDTLPEGERERGSVWDHLVLAVVYLTHTSVGDTHLALSCLSLLHRISVTDQAEMGVTERDEGAGSGYSSLPQVSALEGLMLLCMDARQTVRKAAAHYTCDALPTVCMALGETSRLLLMQSLYGVAAATVRRGIHSVRTADPSVHASPLVRTTTRVGQGSIIVGLDQERLWLNSGKSVLSETVSVVKSVLSKEGGREREGERERETVWGGLVGLLRMAILGVPTEDGAEGVRESSGVISECAVQQVIDVLSCPSFVSDVLVGSPSTTSTRTVESDAPPVPPASLLSLRRVFPPPPALPLCGSASLDALSPLLLSACSSSALSYDALCRLLGAVRGIRPELWETEAETETETESLVSKACSDIASFVSAIVCASSTDDINASEVVKALNEITLGWGEEATKETETEGEGEGEGERGTTPLGRVACSVVTHCLGPVSTPSTNTHTLPSRYVFDAAYTYVQSLLTHTAGSDDCTPSITPCVRGEVLSALLGVCVTVAKGERETGTGRRMEPLEICERVLHLVTQAAKGWERGAGEASTNPSPVLSLISACLHSHVCGGTPSLSSEGEGAEALCDTALTLRVGLLSLYTSLSDLSPGTTYCDSERERERDIMLRALNVCMRRELDIPCVTLAQIDTLEVMERERDRERETMADVLDTLPLSSQYMSLLLTTLSSILSVSSAGAVRETVAVLERVMGKGEAGGEGEREKGCLLRHLPDISMHSLCHCMGHLMRTPLPLSVALSVLPDGHVCRHSIAAMVERERESCEESVESGGTTTCTPLPLLFLPYVPALTQRERETGGRTAAQAVGMACTLMYE